VIRIHRPIKVNTKASYSDEEKFVGTFTMLNARYDLHIFGQFTSRTS